MDVRMELSRILITDYGGSQLIFLREMDGTRTFPIEIGTIEAYAIDRRLKGVTLPRPMTHDLLASTIEALGGQLDKIVIDDIRYDDKGSGTFIATLHIRQGDRMVRIDSRPSDAIALGIAYETPLFVADRVLKDVAGGPATAKERIELLTRRLEALADRIAEFSARLGDEQFLAEAPTELVQDYRRQLDEMRTEYNAIDRVLKKLR